jgi:hypothetical protein
MSTTNVPAIQWQNGSPVIPNEQAILAGVQADINAAFGGGVNSSLQTPQGQLAQTETAIIGDKNSQIAYIANQVNPSMASGIWQDAIGEIYFITRIQAEGTVVNCTCVGAVNTVIPVGIIAQDTTGYLYSSTASGTIPSTGSITIPFQNQTTGAIACNPNALTIIVTAIAGWDTITNPTAGAVGNDVESRQAFETRRSASVAVNSVNSIQSIYGALSSIPGILDAFVVDNPLGTTQNYGSTNYPIPAHSVCVSVAGGTASEIGAAIWNNKPPGCGYVTTAGSYATLGTTVVTDSNYIPPVPYTVTWLNAGSTNTFFVVKIAYNTLVPSNIIQLTQTAVVQSFDGLDGNGPAVSIGSSTYSGRYYGNINAINPNVNVIEVYLTTTNSVVATSFVIGQFYQILVLTGTTNAQWNTIAGTSGVTYAVGSFFQAVTTGVGTGTAMQFALLINYGIDQLPVLAPSNVTVLVI